MMKLKYPIIFLIFGLMTQLFAGTAGKNGLAFLKIDVDGRASAMGGAFTALASDATSAFWNPAGLARANTKSFTVMHNAWIADITQQYAAVHLHQGKHNYALSFNLMTIPGIEIRGTAPSDNPNGVVDAINLSGTLSYATTIYNDWFVGLNLKYLYEKYYLADANGFAVDLGVQKVIMQNMMFGASMQNLGSMGTLQNESTQLPMLARAGIAYNLPWKLFENTPLIAADIQYVKDEDVALKLGTEIFFRDLVAIRAGYVLGDRQQNFSVGLGLNYKGYRIDYAYAPFKDELGNAQRISFGMNF
jgi:hypothetical protein